MLEKLVTLEIPVVTQENLAPSIMPMSIHRRIKERRETLKLSMEALAEKVGVVWQTVQQWEKQPGGTAPKRERLQKVADALETTPEYLSFGDDASHQSDFEISDGAARLIVEIKRAAHAGIPEAAFEGLRITLMAFQEAKYQDIDLPGTDQPHEKEE